MVSLRTNGPKGGSVTALTHRMPTLLLSLAFCASVGAMVRWLSSHRHPHPESTVIPSSVSIRGARIHMGPHAGRNIVVWVDYECSQCRQFATMLDSLVNVPGASIGYDIVPIARRESRDGIHLVSLVLCAEAGGVGGQMHRRLS